MRIRNLTKSPYPVVLADGSKVILAAAGILEDVEVHPMHLPLYRAVRFLEVTEVESNDHSLSINKKSSNRNKNSKRQVNTGAKGDDDLVNGPGQSDK